MNSLFDVTPADQLEMLRAYFKDLADYNPDFADMSKLSSIPKANNLYVVPKYTQLAGTYQDALKKVHEALSVNFVFSDSFLNSHNGKLAGQAIKPQSRTQCALDEISVQQNSLTMIIPAQFNFYQDTSFDELYASKMIPCEFGLDPLTVALITLSHQLVLLNCQEWIAKCAGAYYGIDHGHSNEPGTIIYSLKNNQELYFYGAECCLDNLPWATGFKLK